MLDCFAWNFSEQGITVSSIVVTVLNVRKTSLLPYVTSINDEIHFFVCLFVCWSCFAFVNVTLVSKDEKNIYTLKNKFPPDHLSPISMELQESLFKQHNVKIQNYKQYFYRLKQLLRMFSRRKKLTRMTNRNGWWPLHLWTRSQRSQVRCSMLFSSATGE